MNVGGAEAFRGRDDGDLDVVSGARTTKRKERPPKDARPKEKRFRHGGRKGRRRDRPGR